MEGESASTHCASYDEMAVVKVHYNTSFQMPNLHIEIEILHCNKIVIFYRLNGVTVCIIFTIKHMSHTTNSNKTP